MRGYNLDHGTDLATFVDGMPINQPTHAHGQGYTDLNFMIPELVDALSYTKVRTTPMSETSARLARSAWTIGTRFPTRSLSVPERSRLRVFAAGSGTLGEGNLLGAVEAQHYDGPFVNPDDQRKENAVLRYSEGDPRNGYSLTAMYYHDLWNNTTDIPLRAITEAYTESLRHAQPDGRWTSPASQPLRAVPRDDRRRTVLGRHVLHLQRAASVQRLHPLPGQPRPWRPGGSVRKPAHVRRHGGLHAAGAAGRNRKRALDGCSHAL